MARTPGLAGFNAILMRIIAPGAKCCLTFPRVGRGMPMRINLAQNTFTLHPRGLCRSEDR